MNNDANAAMGVVVLVMALIVCVAVLVHDGTHEACITDPLLGRKTLDTGPRWHHKRFDFDSYDARRYNGGDRYQVIYYLDGHRVFNDCCVSRDSLESYGGME